MKFWKKIVLAIGIGLVTGYVIGPKVAYIKPIGTLFLNMLNMIIVPLVFCSMSLSIKNFPSIEKLGKIGVRTLFLYGITTTLTIFIGIGLANFLDLGKSLSLTAEVTEKTASEFSIATIVTEIVPKNPFRAFVEGNILQVIFLSIFFGIALHVVGEKARPVIQFLESLSEIMRKLTNMVMSFSPYGVFALMAWAAGSFGMDMLLPLLQFLGAYYLASALFLIALSWFMISFLAKLRLCPFFQGISDAVVTAASTCSSSATLPVTIDCATRKLGISASIANFVLPLGCILNMNGSALFQSMAAVFIAQIYNIPLGTSEYFMLFSCIGIANLGTASIPGGSIVMLSMIFSSIGIPIEGVGILASIDRLRDMATTTLNISGDMICATYVAAKENELSTDIYYQAETEATAKA